MADRRLQVFHAVAKQLSFTKAADVLFMTQPAVTFQIKQLEEHFNTRLFDRGHGRIALTPAGEVVLGYAERILGLSSELDVRLSELTGEIGGSLMVGASTTIAEFMLPGILGEFKSTYPNVRSRLMVGNSESIETSGHGTHHRHRLHRIALARADLECEVCCDDELVVICHPRFPLARHKELTPQKLLEHAFVSREPGSGTREFTENYLRSAGVTLDQMNVVMELGSPIALNGVVETGLGFAIASRASVTKEQRLGDIVAIPLKPRLIRTLSMVYPKEKFRSRLVATFVEFAATRLRALIGEEVLTSPHDREQTLGSFMSRPIRARLDWSALRHNHTVVRRHAGAARVWSVVKADAYGHGLLPAARRWAKSPTALPWWNSKAPWPCAMPASRLPILMLEGPYQADDLPLFAELELTPVLHTMWQVDALIDCRLPRGSRCT
jgi:DNA-binding transcriptional LysR family regulator